MAGFQTAPTASTTNSQTITAGHFGTSKAATVTCTVNPGGYKDTYTIVRLEKSTAAPWATVGAPVGTLVGGTEASALVAAANNAATTAVWSSVSGTGKPQDNATVGATFGDYYGSGKNISGTITPGNISTYIANAAIGNAQIGGDLYSSNWSGWGGNGWLLSRAGNMYINNLYARGDIEASRLKAGAAMVDTLHIKGEAVVVPRIASTQSGLYFGSGMSATVQSVYIDAGGANVTVVGKVTVSVPQSMYYQTIQSTLFLYAPNGQLLDSSSGVTTGAGGTLSLMVMGASPQAGTYYMTVSSAGSVTVSNRVLSATGAKR